MRLIHELISDYAAATPQKTALQDAYGEMSYGELEARSAALSHMLTALGVKHGDAVAVYVYAGTITSSPSRIPKILRFSSSAAVPELKHDTLLLYFSILSSVLQSMSTLPVSI